MFSIYHWSSHGGIGTVHSKTLQPARRITPQHLRLALVRSKPLEFKKGSGYHDILAVGNLTELHALLLADGVPHLVRGRPARAGQPATCAIYLDLPNNGVGVELFSAEYGGALRARCEARQFDLCASS